MSRIRKPSPSIVVAGLALFMALTGVAVAGPAALTAQQAVAIRTAEFRLGPEGEGVVAVTCPRRHMAISGGWTTTGGGIVTASQSFPSGATWRFRIRNQRSDGPAVGNVYAVCLR